MIKRYSVCMVLLCLVCMTSGCVALLAGAAGAGGTAVWLAGKVSQDLDAAYEPTLAATEAALDEMKLLVTKKTVKTDVSQIMAEYTDTRMIWIDIRRVTDTTTKVEIRVGAAGDEKAAREIMSAIERNLGS